MFCQHCGKPVAASDRFCRQCGQAIGISAAAPSPAPTGTVAGATADATGSDSPAAGSTPDECLRRIAEAAVRQVRTIIDRDPTGKAYEVYFRPTDRYADSFLRVFRSGKLFRAADASAPIESVEVLIGIRPGVAGPQSASYGLLINTPETAPAISSLTDWTTSPVDGDEMSPERLPELERYFMEVLAGELFPDERIPPSELPE